MKEWRGIAGWNNGLMGEGFQPQLPWKFIQSAILEGASKDAQSPGFTLLPSFLRGFLLPAMLTYQYKRSSKAICYSLTVFLKHDQLIFPKLLTVFLTSWLWYFLKTFQILFFNHIVLCSLSTLFCIGHTAWAPEGCKGRKQEVRRAIS